MNVRKRGVFQQNQMARYDPNVFPTAPTQGAGLPIRSRSTSSIRWGKASAGAWMVVEKFDTIEKAKAKVRLYQS
jgi:hypothetical protein